jgi:hypothetical protein
MKKFSFILILTTLISCGNDTSHEIQNTPITEKTEKDVTSKKIVPIIGERIDGPANIRSKPNGEVLFSLDDNVLVDVNQEKDGWVQLLVYADIEYDEFEMDSIIKDRPIIIHKHEVGKILKTHSPSTGQGRDESYVMLYGYTHKNNIKPETVIETRLLDNLKKEDFSLTSWTEFIALFELDTDAIDYDEFETFYNYENSVDDPSPGFRIVLLFKNKKLIGFIHSRDLNLSEMKTHKLDWSYKISFFNNYPTNKQQKFVDYMNEWIQGVD